MELFQTTITIFICITVHRINAIILYIKYMAEMLIYVS